jgi:hypothetical protein
MKTKRAFAEQVMRINSRPARYEVQLLTAGEPQTTDSRQQIGTGLSFTARHFDLDIWSRSHDRISLTIPMCDEVGLLIDHGSWFMMNTFLRVPAATRTTSTTQEV